MSVQGLSDSWTSVYKPVWLFSTSSVDQLVAIWLLGMLVIEGVIGTDTEETGMDFKYGWCAHLQGELEL